MAGRVGRRINDKFYFVVDEVGGSSDCESELTSDNDVRPIDGLSGGNDVTKANDTHATKISPVASENENKTPDVEIFNCLSSDENTLKDKCTSSNSDEGKHKNGNSDPMDEKNSPKIKNCLPSEESTAVVDMDVDSPLDVDEPLVKPLLKVLFRDESAEKRFKSSFFKFISQKFEDCTVLTNSENSLEVEVYDADPRKLRGNDLLDFNLDTTPGDSHLEVPHYGKSHDLVLSDKSLEEKQSDGKLFPTSTSCFNCLGNHNLRDCPKEKDFREINKNRFKFQSQKEKVPKASRYHLDEYQKFSHLVPGVISKKLRNALNLKRDQQPGFIYRMRLLGYPPGWLEEAKVSHSGVALYDDTGIPVLEEDEEEGEILPEGAKDKFDITKIIEFPGFNVPLPSNFRDVSNYLLVQQPAMICGKGGQPHTSSTASVRVTRAASQQPSEVENVHCAPLTTPGNEVLTKTKKLQEAKAAWLFFANIGPPGGVKESKFYHCPALSEEQSKENLIKLLEPKTVQAYVKKSLSSQRCDEKSLPQNELKRRGSPTIEEMEEKKRQLLMELNSEDSSLEAKTSSEASDKCQTPTAGESDDSRKVGTVKNLEFGTPILKSVSPFSKLPARELFSCNVSDVINFENLPNATGKYEAMREVISKIRISVSKSQKEGAGSV